eukprot:TRINITY_DN1954_c0_g1_i4.p2 TRINITY_DN1954_c0_g1~~TRINITY_DN1954_c0_g1_i4.p2  ORF type:complete len:104 (-),score=12.44 TRINITY_DN1954_c0_g1_i4:141-452(-)
MLTRLELVDNPSWILLPLLSTNSMETETFCGRGDVSVNSAHAVNERDSLIRIDGEKGNEASMSFCGGEGSGQCVRSRPNLSVYLSTYNTSRCWMKMDEGTFSG